MTSRVTSSLVSLTAASIVQVACAGGAALVATLRLGAHDRGLMVIGLTLASFAALVSGLGTGSAFRSYLPNSESGAHRARLVAAFCWCSAGGALLSVLGAALATVASARLISPDLATPGFVVAVAAFAAAQVALLQINEAWFADGRFRRGSATAAVTAAGGLVGVAAAATVYADAAVLLLAQAVGNLAVSTLQLPALRRAGLVRWSVPSVEAVAALLRRGIPALGLNLGLAIVLRADRYILGALSGPFAVGVYSVAATVSETIRMLPQAVGQLFFRDASLGRGAAESGANARRAIVGGAVSAAAVAVIGWMLIVPVFGEEFSQARVLLLVLLVAELCFAPYAVYSRGLLGGGWTRAAALLGATASAVAVPAYVVASGLGAATGAAVASIVVYGFMSALSWRLLTRRAGG